jgi:hypothetical protein
MLKMSRMAALALMVGAFLGYTTTAFGEFSSKNGSPEGKGAYNVLTVTGGGLAFTCDEGPEVKSPNVWQVERSRFPATKGATLALKIVTWGSCIAEGALKQIVPASGSECLLETNEPKEEEKVLATIVTTCKLRIEVVKGSFCEMNLAETGNKERSGITLDHSGAENENLIVNFSLAKVTTTTSTAMTCELGGIKPTTEAKITGAMEEEAVTPGFPTNMFTLRRLGAPLITTIGGERTIAVLYTGNGEIQPGGLLEAVEELTLSNTSPPYFEAIELVTCQLVTYTNGHVCTMKAKVVKLPGTREGTVYLKYKITFNGRTSEVAVFTK